MEDKNYYMIPKQEINEFIGIIIDNFEDWLEQKGITNKDIPNAGRSQSGEDAALICGDDYDYLQGKIEDILLGYEEYEKENTKTADSLEKQEGISHTYRAIENFRNSEALSEQEKEDYIKNLIVSTAKSMGVNAGFVSARLAALDGAAFTEVHGKKNFLKLLPEDYPGKVFRGISFSSMQLQEKNFRNCMFVNCFGENASFDGCDFGGCVFQGCAFHNCSFAKADFSPTEGMPEKDNFKNTLFEQCNMSECSFDCVISAENVKFNNCKLSEASFMYSYLCQGSFIFSDLSGCFFEGANMQGCDLRDCICSNSFFTHANLTNVNLDCAACDFCIFDNSCLKYVSAENTNFERASFENSDLLKFELKYVKAALIQDAVFDSKISCCIRKGKDSVEFVDIPNEKISFESLKADMVQKNLRDEADSTLKQQNQGIDRE